MKNAEEFIKKELIDLDVPLGSVAWVDVYTNAIEAAEIMTKAELKAYIEGRLRDMPNEFFYP